MLAEIARRRSRDFKFETKVLVMSRSSFSRSFSRTSSASMLFDSCVVSVLTGDGEEIIFYSTIFRNPSAANIRPGARASELRTTCPSEASTNVEFRIGSADVFPNRQP